MAIHGFMDVLKPFSSHHRLPPAPARPCSTWRAPPAPGLAWAAAHIWLWRPGPSLHLKPDPATVLGKTGEHVRDDLA